MSIQIPCPHCGVRPLEEFLYKELPNVPETIANPEARDFDRAFMQANPEGPVRERWFHAHGCRRWVTIDRDTRDETILE